jgi:hypothetical protein
VATTPEPHGGGTETAEQGHGQASGVQEYQQRFEKLMEAARKEFGRRSPEVLDKLAATANNIARRLEAVASDARQRAADEKSAPAAGTSEVAPGPRVAPPVSSGGGATRL